MTAAMYLPTFYVRQKFAMMTNRYEIIAANPDGSNGRLMGLAEQKKMALKEQVTFFSDEPKTRPVFALQGAQGDGPQLRLRHHRRGRTADRLLPQGLRGQPAAHHLPRRGARATPAPGRSATSGSRCCGASRTSTSCRSTSTTSTPDGRPLLSVERRATLRDHYTVHVPDPRVDFRVAAAVAVAMDALMSR